MEILGDDGIGAVLESWEFYAFAVTGIIAFVVQQVSLATGHLAASVATVSVCNPLVSIVIGTLLLDERLAEPDLAQDRRLRWARPRPRGCRRHLDVDGGREGGERGRACGSRACDLVRRARRERLQLVLPFSDDAVV